MRRRPFRAEPALASTAWPDHRLSRRIIGFLRYLRRQDFIVGQSATRDVLAVLGDRPLGELSGVRRRLKILLCGNRSQWHAFDRLFDDYWLQGRRQRVHGPRTVSAAPMAPSAAAASSPWQPLPDSAVDDREPDAVAEDRPLPADSVGEPSAAMWPEVSTDDGIDPDAAGRGELYGADQDSRRRVDLRHLVEPAEIRAAERQARALAVAIRYRLSRRHALRRRGRRIDLRKTLRTNLSHGGEPLRLIRCSPPLKPVRIVVFLDISGSMQHYSRFFLQFIRGLVSEWFETDAYLYHTRLIRVTEALREKDALQAMERLSLLAEGFGGGTNLVRSLQTFHQDYARASLNSRTVVFILGDGYDSGGADRLAEQLARLRRRVRRLVWLNPLLGWENYRPQNASMKAALPYLDVFAAANTLESLAQIEPMLEHL